MSPRPRLSARPRVSARQRAARSCTALGLLGLAGGAAATLARSLPGVPGLAEDSWVMVTTFTDAGALGYGVGLIGLGAATALGFRPVRLVAGLVTVALAALHLSWVVPRWVADGDLATGPAVRVLSQNVELGRADPAGIVTQAGAADVVVLVELTDDLAAALDAHGIGDRFPYAAGGPLPRDGASGTRVYSRYLVQRSHALDAALGNQHWLVTVDVPGLGPLTVAAVHPQRPVWGGTGWSAEQTRVRALAPRSRTVLTGDFNAVDSHPSLRAFAADGFRDSAAVAGAGWVPTWPARGPVPPLITIDHVLLSPDLTATAFATVRTDGTDHRGVLATVAVHG